MIKKIFFTTISLSVLLLAQDDSSEIEIQRLKAEIQQAKAQKKDIEVKIKNLQAKLPVDEALISKVQLGYVKTDGNTKTQTFSLDAKAKKAWGKNLVELTLDAQYGESDNLETNNKYLTELSYNYSMTQRLSITYLLGYKYDKFSTYDYQIYSGPGLKCLVLKTKKQKFYIEASIFYSIDKIQKKYLASYSNLSETYTSYRTKINYDLQILQDLKFEQELSYRSSFESTKNYFIYSKSALSSKISSMLSTGLSYKINYTNQVAAGVHQKDTTMEAFLSIDY